MTIFEAISKADEFRNNRIEAAVKIAMLSELDGRIYAEVIEGTNAFEGYNESTPMDTELIVPYPYDALYISYLESEICRISGEMSKYAIARSIFAEKYESFKAWYIRSHEYNKPNIKIPVRRY